MTAVYFDTNALYIEGYRDSFVAGSLVADIVGEGIGIRVLHGSEYLNLELWSNYSTKDGSGFATKAEAKAFLDGEFSKRRPLALEFTQAEPAQVWTIPHDLGFRPGVTLVDSAGDPMTADWRYPDANTVTITFNVPASGTAYLS